MTEFARRLMRQCVNALKVVEQNSGTMGCMSHDLAAVPDACADGGNTCLREHYMYRSHIIS